MRSIATKIEQLVRRIGMGEKRFEQEEVDSLRALILSTGMDPNEAFEINPSDRRARLQAFAKKEADAGISKPTSSVRVGPSSIPNAGDGVFATANAKRGTIMCIFPGTVFRPNEVYNAINNPGCPLYNRICLHDLEHCAGLYDGTVLDAGKESEGEWTPHPFAVAHKCNHPPRGTMPNVMKLAFLWRPALPVNAFTTAFNDDSEEEEVEEEDAKKSVSVGKEEEDLPSGVPHASGLSRFWLLGWNRALQRERRIVEKSRDPTLTRKRHAPDFDFSTNFVQNESDRSLIRGLAFLSTRDIEAGEELFMNYRFNPNSLVKRPDWYHAIDEKEDAARSGVDG